MNKLIILLIIIISLVTLYFYNSLPQEIPVHWNIKGDVDSYQTKIFIWVFVAIPLFLLGLKRIIPKIDPRKDNFEKHMSSYELTINSIIIFMCVIHLAVLFYSLGYKFDMGMLVKGGIGIIFIIIGNVLTRARHNYFFGIRTPWTLANETVWKKTHRVGGYIFVLLGLIYLSSAPFNNPYTAYAMLGSTIALIAFTFVYSYWIFKKLENSEK